MSLNSTDQLVNLAEEMSSLKASLDEVFLVIMGIFVLMMQTGFAFLEAGSVRSKNTTNLIIKNMLDSFVSGVAYWTLGYAFAFGEGNGFIGWHNFSSSWLPKSKMAFFFFQYVFAATAATIVSGAVAERCEMVAYFVYSFGITSFIYPVVTHWVWHPDGWLAKGMEYDINGAMEKVYYHDFAGSGVVHCVGGTAALVGALILGPRYGRFHRESKTTLQLRWHSLPLTALGGFILCFGFLAFNGGSQLTVSNEGDGEIIGLAVVNTVISGSTAAIVSLAIRRIPIFGGTWSFMNTMNGALAGMVAICGGCNIMQPWAAPIVGAIAGVSFNFTSWYICKLKIDDPVDAVAVHIGGGVWGVIAVAFLKYDTGIVMNADRRSGLVLAWQLVGLCSIVAWTAVLCTLMFGIMRLAGIFRVPIEMEKKVSLMAGIHPCQYHCGRCKESSDYTNVSLLVHKIAEFHTTSSNFLSGVTILVYVAGLDIPKHGEPAYPLESYGHGHVEKILRVNEDGQLVTLHLGYSDGNIKHEKDIYDHEIPELKAMNYQHKKSEPGFEPVSVSNGAPSKPFGQINAGFEELERTAL